MSTVNSSAYSNAMNSSQLDAVSTSEQREELVSLASATEDWLYDDGYDADKDQVKDTRVAKQ